MAQKRKILFLITQSEFGGAQRFLSTLVPELSKDSYNILVATGSNGDKNFTQHLNNLGVENTTINHLVRNPNPWHDFLAVFELRRLIKEFNPNTLFLLSSKAGFLGSLANHTLKASEIKVVYRIGGWAFNDPQNCLRSSIILNLERLSARWKDIIVVNNDHDLKQSKNLKIQPKEKTLLIHNGLDTFKMKTLSRSDARKKLGISEGDFVVGTIANFYPAKGLKYFVESAEIVKGDVKYQSVKFVIIGHGAYPPPKSENINLLGRIPEASKYLSAFDIFVSPSVKEGFPWAVLEAMASKVPVIATRVGATPEIVKDGKNGLLVNPKSPEQIAEAIIKLMQSERIQKEFGIQGNITVQNNFDLYKMSEAIKKLI